MRIFLSSWAFVFPKPKNCEHKHTMKILTNSFITVPFLSGNISKEPVSNIQPRTSSFPSKSFLYLCLAIQFRIFVFAFAGTDARVNGHSSGAALHHEIHRNKALEK